MRYRWRILAMGCVAIVSGLAVLFWPRFPKPHADPNKLLAAEDEVYEVVVRDLITPTDGQVRIKQLVFNENVLTELSPEADMKACKESARKNLRLAESVPQYNSLADKIYRIFHGGDYRPIQADTIQDFLKQSCTPGRLSQTFHTDLSRVFIGESIQFEDWPVDKNGSKSFEQLLPEASGIIALSHVGFDPGLAEAIVVVSYVCGDLCGSGHRYILKKKKGHWEIANKLMLWLS